MFIIHYFFSSLQSSSEGENPFLRLRETSDMLNVNNLEFSEQVTQYSESYLVYKLCGIIISKQERR